MHLGSKSIKEERMFYRVVATFEHGIILGGKHDCVYPMLCAMGGMDFIVLSNI
jgi:hypothetical protein